MTIEEYQQLGSKVNKDFLEFLFNYFEENDLPLTYMPTVLSMVVMDVGGALKETIDEEHLEPLVYSPIEDAVKSVKKADVAGNWGRDDPTEPIVKKMKEYVQDDERRLDRIRWIAYGR